MNNYWDTNYRAGQGGHFQFHYILTSSSSTDVSALSRMGWEEVTPLELNVVTSQDKATSAGARGSATVEPAPSGTPSSTSATQPLDARQDGFVDIDDPCLLLETMKPAEDGNGIILRFLDLGGKERAVNVHLPHFRLSEVWQTDAVERNKTAVSMVNDNQFQYVIHPHEIVTLRVIQRGRQLASETQSQTSQ
jgi:alpha-mannosidase